MTVDRFARIDANDDGMLDAGELDSIKLRGHGHGHGYGHMHGSDMTKKVVNAQFANYLTEQVEDVDVGTDIASRIMHELDGDHSGGLNSEEIAGTRLAQLIGGDFFDIDADKNGALSEQELADFVTNYLLGGADETVPDAAAAAAPVDETPAADDVTNPDAVAQACRKLSQQRPKMMPPRRCDPSSNRRTAWCSRSRALVRRSPMGKYCLGVRGSP